MVLLRVVLLVVPMADSSVVLLVGLMADELAVYLVDQLGLP